jgi:hypothetical protein
MPREIQRNLVEPVAAPQHHVPATARELRVQAVHRLQIGLFGLAAMLLLVALANIIMDRAKMADAAAAAPEAIASDSEHTSSDPLADIGVVPAADPSLGVAPAAKR